VCDARAGAVGRRLGTHLCVAPSARRAFTASIWLSVRFWPKAQHTAPSKTASAARRAAVRAPVVVAMGVVEVV
jgi:hypothetical protein